VLLAFLCALQTAPSGVAAVPELSGLVPGSRPGVLWAHGDSGQRALLHPIRADGRPAGPPVRVKGGGSVDWEDVARGPDGTLYVGDIGNNRGDRRELAVLVVPEPAEGAERVEVARSLRFRYPDQKTFPEAGFDAEALAFVGGRLLVFTKRVDDRTVAYALRPDAAEPQVAERLLEIPGTGVVTGAAVAPDGKRLALLAYGRVSVLEVVDGRPADRVSAGVKLNLPREHAQAEAVAWDADGLLVGSEKGGLFRFAAP
jgi:hypothetical protein